MTATGFRHLPLIHLPSFSSSPIFSLAKLLTRTSRRHQSSSRRTTKRLRVKPDPSFTALVPPEKINDHIVFNPPSSTPSVFHTPAAFLPSSDRRRQILAQSHGYANPYDQPTRRLPPPVRAPYEKKYHLNEDDITQIRQLRTQDPVKWTRPKLAVKFDCSQYFVGLVCQTSEEVMEMRKRELEEVQRKWGPKKQSAREDRKKRRMLWGRDG